jgi:3-oxoacyl-[acyl-carrier protein] reductase
MDQPITVITGTRTGIGRYLAEHYLGQGHVVIGCSRSESDLEHKSYQHHELDVADEDAVGRLFLGLRDHFGRVDNLVNNAGVASMNHALLTPVGALQRVLNTNLVGSFLFCREAAKIMRRERYGRIVNFVTVAIPLKLEGEAAYVASKGGVLALTEVLAREFGGFGITVNAVGPTPIETDLIRSVPRQKIEALIARQAIRRLGTFEDVSNVVDFFLRGESSMITGQCVYLGGV